MDSLRVVLMIIGLLVILALLAQGLRNIRKNNQVARGQRENLERKRRRAQQQEPADLFSAAEQVEVDDDELADFDPLTMSRSKKSASAKDKKGSATTSKVEPTLEQIEIDLSAAEAEQAQQDDMFADLQSDEENRVVSPTNSPEPPEVKAVDDGQWTEDELHEVTAEDTEQRVDEEVVANSETEEQQKPAAEPEMEVITLYVTGDIQGAILLQMTTELGLKYGDMDILHRHQESSGHGPVLFSVANMFNPGTFDIYSMETFSTEGIVLFMTLPVEGDGHQAFTMMYNAANKIAEAMPRAAVLDGNRNPVTKQSVQHAYQRIREFERQQRLHRKPSQW
ncbi:cell division protein ZipA [Aliidiomarina minuta]|uniref:Cell division protein ZipA n=1 Tax=Aliidiomarina minuta TaxID=880057 RepID=A0A432W7N1_9GAMM|nr:cell division protein ZipA [Aliidiomarina minuta]RUO26090.1 cell division protein ZipA [Aliidiomarina minuta]